MQRTFSAPASTMEEIEEDNIEKEEGVDVDMEVDRELVC